MYRQEQIKPYCQHEEKGKQMEQMFNTIAPTYDALNHRLSWNIDKYWRNKAISYLCQFQPKTILDVATGTGDFALLAARRITPDHILASDISEGMMDIGKQKAAKEKLADIVSFQRQDCMSLDISNDNFDAVMSAFGIRNFPNLDKGLAEMCRVMKPGGHLVIIELTHPIAFPMKHLFNFYSHHVLPFVGRLISKDRNAYDYLTKTIDVFPQGEEMMHILKKAGFKEPRYKRLTFGICTMYMATK
ncbi:MAG: bifunctional demethylmenaquinone methyltransferase/2-methoxy-6-polyprenyl-1,4-benzoquinol methylase UbiE [Prevotella sp.]|nr:bifunctional demethylmenaquinone methyltransferase/2-methoxy-6-polyprenyl-1,4-benzoquinol methylase UbiE [Prevotella sp.]